MIIFMRTTIVIDDVLFREAKRRAAETGQTLSAVIAAALRDAFAAPKPKPRKPFRVLTFPSGGKKKHLTPADMYRLLEEEDLASLRRGR